MCFMSVYKNYEGNTCSVFSELTLPNFTKIL